MGEFRKCTFSIESFHQPSRCNRIGPRSNSQGTPLGPLLFPGILYGYWEMFELRLKRGFDLVFPTA